MYSDNLKPNLVNDDELTRLVGNASNITNDTKVKKYNIILLSLSIIFFGIILIFRYNSKKKKDSKELFDQEGEKNRLIQQVVFENKENKRKIMRLLMERQELVNNMYKENNEETNNNEEVNYNSDYILNNISDSQKEELLSEYAINNRFYPRIYNKDEIGNTNIVYNDSIKNKINQMGIQKNMSKVDSDPEPEPFNVRKIN